MMKNEISITTYIRRQAQRVFAISSAVQLVIVCGVMVVLSYKDASSRAEFLAASNRNSIGLMISTGDVFQLNNVVSSFVGELTPYVWVVDEKDNPITLGTKVFPGITCLDTPRFLSLDGNFVLLTCHKISYGGMEFGKLLLANKFRVNDWILIFLLLFCLGILTFFFQGKALRNRALAIAGHVENLGSIFDHSTSKQELKNFYGFRKKTLIIEIDALSSKIQSTLIKLLESALLEKQAAIGRLTEQLSHDMRAPLGSFERLLSEKADTPVGNYFGAIRETLFRLFSMLDSLRHSETSLLIRSEISILNFENGIDGLRLRAFNRNVAINLSRISNLRVFLDHGKFERSWINLVSNAIDFANSEVQVVLISRDKDLILEVIDDGPGVPSDFVPHLFQRGATLGKADGTGLGLAYVKHIMQGHGGDVTYRRENGLTIFECKLPNVVVEVDGTMAIEIQQWREPKDAVNKVIAICIHPNSFSIDLVEELKSKASSKFTFSTEYSKGKTDIIVLNNREALLQIIDSDDTVEVMEYAPDLTPEALRIRILRRFSEFQS